METRWLLSSRNVEPAIAKTLRSGATLLAVLGESGSQMKSFVTKSLQALAGHEARFCEVRFGVDKVPGDYPDLMRKARI